jgi:hypothetical protein
MDSVQPGLPEPISLSLLMPNPISSGFRIALGLLAMALPPCMAGTTHEDPKTGESPAAGNNGHLFILSGQSNMTGQLEKGFTAAASKMLGKDNITVVRSMKSGRGIRFWVKDYALPEGHEYAGKLVNGNGSEYPKLLQAVKAAGDTGSFATVTFVWMQGESDANRNLAVAYEKSFNTLLGNLKTDLGLKEMRFVIGRISDYGLHGDKANAWKQMRAAQVRLAESDELGAWIDTDDLNGGDATHPQGELHYPPGDSFKLGERFAEQACKTL